MSRRLRETARHPAAILGAVAVAVVMGLGLAALRTPADTGSAGPRLAISVVPPVEPTVDPGSTMEVGAVTDGFDRSMLARAAALVDDTFLAQEAYSGSDWMPAVPPPAPAPEPRIIVVAQSEAPAADPLNDGSVQFGFDRVAEDLSEARRARQMARDIPTKSDDTSGWRHLPTPDAQPEATNTADGQYSSE